MKKNLTFLRGLSLFCLSVLVLAACAPAATEAPAMTEAPAYRSPSRNRSTRNGSTCHDQSTWCRKSE